MKKPTLMKDHNNYLTHPKKIKGITLISLIITIILLIIITTVSINLLINGGIINKSKLAVDEYSLGEEKDNISLGFSQYQLNKYTMDNANLTVSGANVTGNENDGWKITYTKTNNIYGLSKNGEITEIYNPAKWDKSATEDDFFIWENDYTISGIKNPNGSSGCGGTNITYSTTIEEITIPSRCTVYKGTSNKSINLSSIKKVNIPMSLTTIGQYAFKEYKGLDNIDIPESVTTIEEYAFAYCPKLKSMTIPKTVTKVGSYIFGTSVLASSDGKPGITDLTVDCKSIPSYMCSNLDSLKNVIIGDNTETIYREAFYSCYNLDKITIGKNVKFIEPISFNDCTALSEINVDDQNNYFFSDDGVLYEKSNNQLYFCPQNKTGNYSIVDGVSKISGHAFIECTKLTSVIIPESVEEIIESAFNKWTSDQTIYIRANDKPSGWKSGWNNNCEASVIWGYTGE